MRFTGNPLALIALLAAACGTGPPQQPSPAISVSPSSVVLAPRGTQRFSANVTGARDPSVVWSVDEAVGGAVDDAGAYTAPAAGGQYHVRATLRASAAVSAAATVTVTAPAGAPTIASFTATPDTLAAGQSSTLSWSVSGADSLDIQPGIGAVAAGVTSKQVTPAATTIYTLTATNAAGSATATTTIAVTSATDRVGEGDFVIGPPFTVAPEFTVAAGVPRGAIMTFTLSSTVSAIYPTDFATHMPFTRDVAVYVPNQYKAGSSAPFIVVQDGISFYLGDMTPVLDNMINDRRLPAMIAIFVEPGPNEATPAGERSFEYDTVSDAYVRFIEMELLPKIQKDYGITLTTDPEGRAAMGGSSGGAAAFTMGWFRPDLYHRILTYSGSFTDLQPTASYPHGAWEYHERLIATTEVKPLRVALEVGQNDLNWNTGTDKDRDWLAANRAMAAVLASRGYHYRFVYAQGAGHIDPDVLRQTLPETLLWLWRGYPIP